MHDKVSECTQKCAGPVRRCNGVAVELYGQPTHMQTINVIDQLDTDGRTDTKVRIRRLRRALVLTGLHS